MTDNPKGKNSSSPRNSEESTRVDLGDDLLEKTRVTSTIESLPSGVSRSSSSSSQEIPFDIDDQLHSARILLGEELLEEAKKILRKILIADPRRVDARQLLNQIHEKELKQLFGEGPRRRFLGLDSEQEKDDFSGALTDEVMRELDQDLRLGIFGPDGIPNPVAAGEAQGFPLFSDPEAIRQYSEQLEAQLRNLSGQDRIDLGIAFLEMGLHEIAIRQFKMASHFFIQQSPDIPSHGALVASSLLAYALILAGKAYEASQLVQSVVRDISVSQENKIEFLYLMGRAYEAMGRTDLATHWYQQAMRQEPGYRDVITRIQKLSGKSGKED